MENLKNKKALSIQAKLKTVSKNLFEIRKTEKMIDAHLKEVDEWINEVNKQKRAQLKYKKALEAGDEVTFEVKDVNAEGENEEVEEFNEFDEDDNGAEEVVNEDITKEMRKIKSQIQKLEKQLK